MLPQEDVAKKLIERMYRRELGIARKLLSHAVAATTGEEGAPLHLGKGVRPKAAGLAVGLFSKACKQFRSILELCVLGLCEDAETLNRALFESVLALHFLLRPRLVLRENRTKIKGIPAKPLKRLTSDLRADLYLAHAAIKREKQLRTFRNTHRLKGLSKYLGDPAEIACLAAEARKAIGLGWEERQRTSRNYAGVTIKSLAESLGLLPYYVAVYGQQATGSHAGDAHDFVDFDRANSTFNTAIGPDCEGVGVPLLGACRLFSGALVIVRDRLGLSLDPEIDVLMINLTKERMSAGQSPKIERGKKYLLKRGVVEIEVEAQGAGPVDKNGKQTWIVQQLGGGHLPFRAYPRELKAKE